MDDTIKAQIDAFDQELSEYQKKQDDELEKSKSALEGILNDIEKLKTMDSETRQRSSGSARSVNNIGKHSVTFEDVGHGDVGVNFGSQEFSFQDNETHTNERRLPFLMEAFFGLGTLFSVILLRCVLNYDQFTSVAVPSIVAA